MAYHAERPGEGSLIDGGPTANCSESGPTLADPGLALAWRNRRILSMRLGWPAGAVEVCEQVERECPDGYPNYSLGGSRERPDVGYYALPWKPERLGQRPVFGIDADALMTAIRTQERKLRRGGAPCRCR
ncbi:hypothetical protein [Cryptosporangium sp. NPDC048952]|uniref:hypothetical protein n=1 Tax=Cryptosporangium sp. NPDC048952 TaxID=3363961 RepID=UPI00371A44BD